jgi:hypothetical protein
MMHQIYHIWIHSLSTLHFWNSFSRYHFCIYMCSQYLPHIHPRIPFLYCLPTPIGNTPLAGHVPPSHSLIL